jgi:hypothetical protein
MLLILQPASILANDKPWRLVNAQNNGRPSFLRVRDHSQQHNKLAIARHNMLV